MFVERYVDETWQKWVVLQHGYSGAIIEPHFQKIIKAYTDNKFNVLTFDATHSFNDSDGDVEGNSIETHLHDLEDVIQWAKTQKILPDKYAIGGHSLGGFTSLLYAQEHPDEISHLFPCACVISGKHLKEAFKENTTEQEFTDWQNTGTMKIECSYKAGQTAYRPFSWLENMQDWSALERADILKMPVLMIVGENDEPTPPEHQKILFNILPGDNNELHIIKNTDHCFQDPPQLDRLEEIIDQWLRKQG